MKMLERLRAVCLLLGLAMTGPAAGSPPALLPGVTRHWEVEIHLRYVNRGEKPVTVSVSLPRLRSFPPFQQVSLVRVSPPPAKHETDPDGNELLWFELRNLPPGAPRSIRITGRVALTHLVHFPQSPRELALTQELMEPYDRIRKGLGRDATTTRCLEAARELAGEIVKGGWRSRLVGGVLLPAGKSQTEILHAWVETELIPGEWFPVDPTMGRFDEVHRLRSFLEIRPQYIVLWKGPPTVIRAKVRGPAGMTRLHDLSLQVRYREVFPDQAASAIPRVLPDAGEMEGPGARPGEMEAGGGERPPIVQEIEKGRKLLEKGEEREALRIFEAARERDPAVFLGHREWVTLMFRLGRGSEAKQWYRERFASQEGGGSPEWVRYGLGLSLFQEGNIVEALRLLKELVPDGHNGAIVANDLGRCYVRLKALPLAVEAFKKGVKTDPLWDLPYKNLIRLYGIYEQWEDLLLVARLAETRFERDDEFFGEEGRALYFLGRYREAVSRFQEAIRLNRESGWNHAMCGLAYGKLGEREAARAALKRGLQLGGNLDDPAPFLEELRKLEKPVGK